MKNKNNKFILIDIEIYKMSVIVTWETTAEEIEGYIYKLVKKKPEKFRETFLDNVKGADGICLSIFGSDKLLWLKKRPMKSTEYGVLYHELHHAVYSIAQDHCFNDETEAMAYLYEYIVNICNRTLWK